MKFEGILLDIDDTLYDYDKAHMPALREALDFAARKLSLSGELLNQKFSLAREQIHRELAETAACHNRLLYFQRTLELVNKKAASYALPIYECYWDHFLTNMHPHEQVYEFFDSVRSKRICIVTDLTAQIQYRKIKQLRIAEFIDFIVTSEEAGKEKPHPYIFFLAVNKLNLPLNRLCMIGDSLSKDIQGANQLGIHSFWLNLKGTKNGKELPALTTECASFGLLIDYFN